MSRPDNKNVLFLCTGNYYRSRFAEHLFNQLARQSGVTWRATSRGLSVHPDGVVNTGPLSPFARQAMALRRVPIPVTPRYPTQVTDGDLQSAGLIVALKESEHRCLLESLYPEHAPRVRYWHIDDLDVASSEVALAELEKQVRGLIEELGRSPSR